MAMHEGEVYTCTNNECGCEIEVTKSAQRGSGDAAPRCCCGMAMELTSGGSALSEDDTTPIPMATPY